MVAPLFRRKATPLHKFPAQLASNPPSPFIPVDFPTTLPPKRQYGYGDVVVNLLLTTLAATSFIARAPLVSPPPKAVRAPVSDIVPNLLLTTLASPQQAPFVNFHEQVRRTSLRLSEGLPNLLTGTLTPASVSAMPRPPLVSTVRAARSPQQEVIPNLLLTTLSTTQAAPFFTPDWARPRVAGRPFETVPPNLLTGTLTPQPVSAMPRNALVSPAHKSVKAPQWDVPNLLTLAAPPPSTAPFVAYDWRKPVEIRVKPSGAEPNLLTSTLIPAPISVMPRAALISKAPRPKNAPQWEFVPNLLTSTLTPGASTTAPFVSFDWPLPKRQSGYQSFWYNLSYDQEVTQPFVFYDWPKPATAKAPREEASRNLLTSTLFVPGPQPAPFVAYDWPKPKIRPLPIPDVILNLLTSTLYVAGPSPAPFTQLDWPLPKRKSLYQSFWYNLSYDQELQPFAFYDWARPASVKVPREEAPRNLLTSTLYVPGPSPAPFVSYEWMPPRKTPQTVVDVLPNLLTSTFSPPPVQPDVHQAGGKEKKQKYALPKKHDPKKYELKPKVLREAFEIRREEEFLSLIQERLDELAGIVRKPVRTVHQRTLQKAAELKLLANINALSKSYSVELSSVEAAQELITQRLADLEDEEALAIILIAASL